MDMRFLVASLSNDEVKELHKLTWKRMEQISKDRVAGQYLTIYEIELIHKGEHINAIKAIRTRLDCGLIDAKHMVDNYKEQMLGKGR